MKSSVNVINRPCVDLRSRRNGRPLSTLSKPSATLVSAHVWNYVSERFAVPPSPKSHILDQLGSQAISRTRVRAGNDPATVASEACGAPKVNRPDFRVLHCVRELETTLVDTEYKERPNPARPVPVDGNSFGPQRHWRGREPCGVDEVRPSCPSQSWRP